MTTSVALLVYRRPDLTARVFAEIAAARPPMLLVISDWPDRPEDQARCLEARRIATQVDWPCEVRTCFATEHMGCRLRVASGLDWVFREVEEAIVLEDDCLPHPSFFTFCEEMLERFRNDPRVGHISGSNFQKGFRRTPYSYYFSRHISVWGWATWRRAWRDYDVGMKLWPEVRAGGWHRALYASAHEARRAEKLYDVLYAQGLDTWDYQWQFSRLIQASLAVTPCVNLIANIGFRPDGTHTRYLHDPFADLPVQELPFPLHHPPFMIWDQISDARYNRIASPRFRFHPRRLFHLLAARWGRPSP